MKTGARGEAAQAVGPEPSGRVEHASAPVAEGGDVLELRALRPCAAGQQVRALTTGRGNPTAPCLAGFMAYGNGT